MIKELRETPVDEYMELPIEEILTLHPHLQGHYEHFIADYKKEISSIQIFPIETESQLENYDLLTPNMPLF